MEWSDADQAWVSEVGWTCPASGGPFTIRYAVNDNQGGAATGSKVAAPAQTGRIVFYGSGGIGIMNADGSGKTILTTGITAHHPCLSPDGTRIAFSVWLEGGNDNDIFVMNADGTGQTNLTNHGDDERTPSWSPDGTKIAFLAHSRLTIMNADGTGRWDLVPIDALEFRPSWLPDGSAIVFVSCRDVNFEIYRINLDGTGLTNLTNNPAQDFQPSLSTDGSRIVFTSSRDGVNEIFLSTSDGRNPDSGEPYSAKRLTFSTVSSANYPCWSPDGTRIAYNTSTTGPFSVHLMNPDGTGRYQLSEAPVDNEWAPSWSR
jgi:TolB protein